MKKSMTIFGAILFASVILTSCGEDSPKDTMEKIEDLSNELKDNNAKKSKDNNGVESNTEVLSNEEGAEESSNSCDQFIEDYEKVIDEYIILMKKVKANPSDMSIMQQCATISQNISTMQNDASKCTDEKYVIKLAELANKFAQAAGGM